MDVSKILDELRQEREQLEEAILSLERLARGRGRRRGRPPSWMVGSKEARPSGGKQEQDRSQAGFAAAANRRADTVDSCTSKGSLTELPFVADDVNGRAGYFCRNARNS